MKIVTDRRVNGGMVSKDGAIIVESEEPPAVIVLTPEMKGEAVQWQCRGFPTKYMPATCRE
jgi:hypothetical protein